MMKYVKGEVLSTDHWHELFRMLSMPRGTTLERLTFGDILSAADDILTNVDGLKVVNVISLIVVTTTSIELQLLHTSCVLI